MADLQIIRDGAGNPAFAVIPWQQYIELSPSDEALFETALTEDEEAFPRDIVERLLSGQNPVQVYRNYRGLTQHQLAETVGINPVYLSQIERGERSGSAKTLAAIARALRVDLDDLV